MFHGGSWGAFLRYDETKAPTQIDRALLRRVARYALPYWLPSALMLSLIGFTSFIDLVPPLLYRDLIDHALPNRDVARLNLLALGMVGIPVLSGLIGVIQRYLSAQIGEGIIFDLRQQMYEHMHRMSMRFFTLTKTGEMMSRFSNDVVGAQNAVTGTLVSIVTNVIVLVSTLAIMLSIDWRLTVLSIAVLPLFILPTRRIGVILRDLSRQSMEINARMNTLMNETLGVSGALLVKAFGRQKYEIDRYRRANTEVRDIGVRRAMAARWFFLGMGLVSAIGTGLVYWVGGHLVLSSALTVGTIVAFAVYLVRLYQPLSSLANVRVDFATSMVSFERVFEYLDLPVEIQDRLKAVELRSAQGRVQFDHVSFRYLSAPTSDERPTTDGEPGANGDQQDATVVLRRSSLVGLSSNQAREWALRDVSFEIKPGQLAALVGPSGAGKTTITYLLPRLYDPTSGRILIDGHDLRDVAQASLARQIGMVTQETYLFNDTIRNNLLYARLDATQAEIEAACRAAYIHDFIAGLPDGYDTAVGERGYRLSGGEKQRLAIARVILKDPRILILDEATSHLDSQSERLIQAALEPLLAGRTSLVIAHRLSTILAADVILVLDRGQVVEQGSHAELLARGGLYASLYETQFGGQPALPG